MTYQEAMEAVEQGYTVGSDTLNSEMTLLEYICSDEGEREFNLADDWKIERF